MLESLLKSNPFKLSQTLYNIFCKLNSNPKLDTDHIDNHIGWLQLK